MYTSVFLFSLIIQIVICDDTAKLRYYHSTIDEYTELPLEKAHDIFNTPWYNSSLVTVVFAHGFTGYPKGPAVTAVINSYLEERKSNVVLFNWKEMAASTYPNMISSYVNWAAPNAKKLGYIFSETLLNMSAAGFDLSKTHFVGHSLGAHIFGIAGNTLQQKGIKLPWITGLDPASAGYDNRPASQKLNPGSAGFVSVIHSDPSKYGSRRALGHVDFWPNFRPGAVVQPGCDNRAHPMFSLEDLCNHNRCWQLIVDSLKHPGTILGSYAKNYRKWKNATKKEKEANVLEVGTYAPHANLEFEKTTGTFFYIFHIKDNFGDVYLNVSLRLITIAQYRVDERSLRQDAIKRNIYLHTYLSRSSMAFTRAEKLVAFSIRSNNKLRQPSVYLMTKIAWGLFLDYVRTISLWTW